MQTKQALKLLLAHASGDTGGSRRCAAFLLSLWDGDVYKADLQELLYIDANIHNAMLLVFHHLHETSHQLDIYVTEQQMKPVVAMWGRVFSQAA